MSYVDEVIDLVVKQNPGEPEFHQAVKEVLESLRPVIDQNEEQYRSTVLLDLTKADFVSTLPYTLESSSSLDLNRSLKTP